MVVVFIHSSHADIISHLSVVVTDVQQVSKILVFSEQIHVLVLVVGDNDDDNNDVK